MTDLPSKRDVFYKILTLGSPTVFVYVRTAARGVVLPAHLGAKEYAVLQIGLNMPLPIPDLVIDSVGISGTLTFNRVQSYCFLPWDSIFILAGEDKSACAWTPDMPESFKDELIREAQAKQEAIDAQPPAKVFSLADYKRRKLESGKRPSTSR